MAQVFLTLLEAISFVGLFSEELLDCVEASGFAFLRKKRQEHLKTGDL